MPNSHNNLAGPPEHDDGRLDAPAQVERSWSGVGLAAGPLTVRAKVRVVTGGRVRAVAAAQGRALIALLKAAVPWVDTDDVAAMVAAAATVTPPPLPTDSRTVSYPPADYADDTVTFADWKSVLRSQVADRADIAEQGPLDRYAYFGLDVPQPAGCTRATGRRWYNFDPRGYLECGMAGSLGGWDEDDGQRVPVPGPVHPLVPDDPGEYAIDNLTWTDLTRLAIAGQEYE